MTIEVKFGNKEPIPQAGDILRISEYESLTLVPCPCVSVKVNWPEKGWIHCGPHIKERPGTRIYGHDVGWLWSGTLIRNTTTKSSGTVEKRDLKTLNSDGRTECANCGGPIKIPFPNIRYCPICE